MSDTVKIFQKGFNYSQDGPGNRLVYHLSGCNFACKWCSNPEGMEQKNYKEYTVKEIVEECISCTPMFFSGGGVTFTGGEATMQFDALLTLLKELKQNGINTAIETNGSHKRLVELLPYIDHLIMDFKHYDTVIHKEWIGVGNEQVKNSFSMLSSIKRKVLIRIPIINGFNNSPEGFVEFFKKYNTDNMEFELLSYHEYGKEKWEKPYQITNGFVSREDIKKFQQLFKENNLKLINT
ncbi:MAG: radical SAM protein [Ruminococcaceae bacterium]|nr:radical SAM protein [Oscillospiraceae bacterium]